MIGNLYGDGLYDIGDALCKKMTWNWDRARDQPGGPGCDQGWETLSATCSMAWCTWNTPEPVVRVRLVHWLVRRPARCRTACPDPTGRADIYRNGRLGFAGHSLYAF